MSIFQFSDRIIVPTEKKYGYAQAKKVPFNLLDLNPALWLDAADADSFTLSGSNITQWADKSGNSRHATSSGMTPPTKVGDAVVFAEDSGLNITSPLCAPQTFFIALHTTDTFYVLFRNSLLIYGPVGQSGSAAAGPVGFGTPTYRVDGVLTTLATRGQVYTALNNRISILSIVGASTATWTALTLANYSIGYSFAGKFFEFISIPGTPESYAIESIEAYLLDKWAA